MKSPKNYNSALRGQVHLWIDKVRHADILVGIPCYNNEDTIRHVVATVAEGLHRHFPAQRTAILISDGGSLDDTREEAYEASIPEAVQRRVMIYRGLPGKGTSVRAIFESARLLDARACAVFDSDLRSITPDWVLCLLAPVWEGKAEFVAPYYQRHKYDGTITNQFVYPVTRSLYGLRVRQPIGGDFGFSGRLAAFYAGQDVWLTDVAHFGIDVWMTSIAINEGFNVMQADLGVKRHNPKDPSQDLGPMFCQVISTLFFLMGQYETSWRQIKGSRPVELAASASDDGSPDPLTVNIDKLREEYVEGFNQFAVLYQKILEPENYEALKECARSFSEGAECRFTADLWAKVVFDFAYTYQTWNRNRRRLVDLLVPLYFGRTAAYCRQVADLIPTEAEAIVEAQAETFEKLKPYLIRKFELWER